MQMLLRTIDIELFEIGVAIEELLMIGDAIVLDPIVGTDEAIRQALSGDSEAFLRANRQRGGQ